MQADGDALPATTAPEPDACTVWTVGHPTLGESEFLSLLAWGGSHTPATSSRSESDARPSFSMTSPFHFAFFVNDLEATRRFYGDVLGCKEGRSTDSWVDFDFFGNQISAHRSDQPAPTRNTGSVDSVAVPMPHFGAILPWGRFQAVADGIRAARIPFVIEPTTRFAGEQGEQATMFVLDPSGNALEFKSFRHPEHVFTG